VATETEPQNPVIGGPYFEDLEPGQEFATAPAVTLTDGVAAVHQSIVGDRMPLSLSEGLARAVLGYGPVPSAALVWNLAIGQSSVVTQHVRANLFYRGLSLQRMPQIGDTLSTATRIVGLQKNGMKPGRPPTGLVTLRIMTRDQENRPILDFQRCAMLAMRERGAEVETCLPPDVPERSESDLLSAVREWTLPPPQSVLPRAGTVVRVDARDLVSGAPELARLIGNVAEVHHDATVAGGSRLVFGGHTIAIALTQAARALPDLLTVLAWESCDHLAPVHEGDMLSSAVQIQRVRERAAGGRLLWLRSIVSADSGAGPPLPVLDWRFIGVCR
jgi:acyl dehydratase